MTKPLEPTETQVDKIATIVAVASSDAYAMENPRDVELAGAARVLWALIRDQVLEAAAKECDGIGSVAAAGVVRAMKGTP